MELRRRVLEGPSPVRPVTAEELSVMVASLQGSRGSGLLGPLGGGGGNQRVSVGS